ncbi:unnamed protein product [Aureobasidium vineae]|uniref:Uncharacterized protein n=1 Tax=Aureobasidium vineae TaxID=2773715 RepID=A0A9N8JR69_9PEZI|nr:unnamed protein product [Aureobasidium vineae]
MRFSIAIAAFSLSLATALPTKRELVAPFNDDAGNGLIPGIGKAVDGGFNAVGGAVAGAVRAGDNSKLRAGDDSKRALVAPFNDESANGLIPGVGQAVDGGFNAVGSTVAGAVRAGDNSKRALVAPFNDDAGNGLIPGIGTAVDGGFNAVGGAVAAAVRAGDASDAE